MIIGGAFNISPMSCNSSSQLTTDSTEEDSLVYEEVADDDKSLQGLSKLTVSLQGFTTTTYNASADFCERVNYDISVDFPKRSVAHSDAITKWLVEKIEDSGNMDGELPPMNAIYINYARRTNAGWRYEG